MAYNPNLLDGMTIFAEVVDAGSFTQAAAHTGHSTSYISKEINKLEGRLGVRLMNRTTRSLSLTPEGQLYYQQCQQIISDAEEARLALMGQQLKPSGTLRVSCLTSLDMNLLQTMFSGFLTRFPEVNLELDMSNRKVDLIAEGFDVIVRATPQLEDSSFISRRIMQSQTIIVAAPEYLRQYGVPERPEDIRQHKCICYSYLKQPRLWHFKNQYGKETQVEVDSYIQTNSSAMELSLCKSGHGIVRLPQFMLQDELETGELVELFPDYRQPEVNVYLVYPSRKHLSPKVRAFIDYVAEYLSEDR
ncbi:LysR family transcriptional regulator [Endozoicomonadaceae bacterium StTr2]